MNDEELLIKIKKVKNNLENVKKELTNVQNVLNQSITFDNDGFKSDDISKINNKINKQINNLNNKIIPKINNMQVIQ